MHSLHNFENEIRMSLDLKLDNPQVKVDYCVIDMIYDIRIEIRGFNFACHVPEQWVELFGVNSLTDEIIKQIVKEFEKSILRKQYKLKGEPNGTNMDRANITISRTDKRE